MTGDWRPADRSELGRIWPAVRTAVVAQSREQFLSFYDQAPWRVRVSSRGDVLVLKRWRADLDILAIKAAVAPPGRTGALIREAFAVARAQGLSEVLSPLILQSALGPYLSAGMSQTFPLVALSAPSGAVSAAAGVASVRVRPARASDIEALCDVDESCFRGFWHYGPAEIAELLDSENTLVAYDGHAVLGFATSSMVADTCTLGRLAVLPAVQNRGVGAALVGEVARWATMQSARSLSLCTQADNVGARRFYARLGLIEATELYALALGAVDERL